MSAAEDRRAAWLDTQFWDRLDLIENRHQKIQSEHEAVRRGMESLTRRAERAELQRVWRQYCEVIAELDQTTAEIEALRRHTG
jgi:hypothetical protein